MSAVLVQLLAQGVEADKLRGADLATLRAVVEEAGEMGAVRALTRLGLADAGAERDLAELRALLEAWRDAKRSAWKAAFGWLCQVMGALLLAGLAMKLGFGELIR